MRGGGRASLLSLVSQLGLNGLVSMPGWSANPYSFMARADLFVLSSNWEGFPNVLIEALFCGCGIVSTDCPHGPREILDNGLFGELVPVENELKMTEAIFKALKLKPNHEVLIARAMEFSKEMQVVQFEKLIHKVITLGELEVESKCLR